MAFGASERDNCLQARQIGGWDVGDTVGFLLAMAGALVVLMLAVMTFAVPGGRSAGGLRELGTLDRHPAEKNATVVAVIAALVALIVALAVTLPLA